ncbi:MAG: NAD(P)/FAD-dependent oxidoreductase [Anaerolineaceae bacterium]|nr:NAD(P)/FAD-dependent oxidoreductase [Anaerolineaceae bacterium]
MEYDAIIIGGGIAGLTAAAYLSKAGKTVLLCEKEEKCGGLVNNFERDGFIYDGGVRALENSGVLFPMLRQLGISLDFVPNKISMGIEDKIIDIVSDDSVEDYKNLLIDLYPDSQTEIEQIFEQIRKIMHYMDVQYGIDNPMFLDFKKDKEYMLKEIVPWMFKYALTAPKISKMNEPVVDFLKRYTHNQSLLDIITQHFFQETPAFFALSYLKLYLDYHYPLGGTSKIILKLIDLITEFHGVIRNNTKIVEIDIEKDSVKDSHGNSHQYRRLIWAADLHTLYRLLDPQKVSNVKTKKAIIERQKMVLDKSGNDSIYTVFLGVDIDQHYFAERCSEHFFYTPSRVGQSVCGPLPVGEDQETVEKWLEKFFELTTYEISIPVLRDSSMAPEGKTGLIISFLFDYKLTKQIEEQGWYSLFKAYCEESVIRVLNETVFPGLEDSIVHKFSSTPLTMAKLTDNHEGAITGWSFTNRPVPAESRLPKILNAIKTPIEGVYQAGHWTYSPSGLPISFLTGKIAADRVIKDLKK